MRVYLTDLRKKSVKSARPVKQPTGLLNKSNQGAPPLRGGRAIRSNLLPPPAAKVFPLLSLARFQNRGYALHAYPRSRNRGGNYMNSGA
jgi:hypothetical protein